MYVEITSTTIDTKKQIITIKGIEVESVLMFNNLFEDFECPEHTFVFKGESDTATPAMKYLLKVVSSRPECRQKKTFAEKIQALEGKYINLADGFLKK